jgi:cytochrome c
MFDRPGLGAAELRRSDRVRLRHDGNRRNAHDNNTLSMSIWLAIWRWETPMKCCSFVRMTALVLACVLGASAHAQGDATRGADIFKQNCSMCHSPEPGQNLVGPSLFSVVGRAAASIASFSYSSAMKGCGIVWTPDQLMAYLKAPRKYVPGVKMMFPGLSDEKERENLVAFLATLGSANAASSPQAKANPASE